MRSNKYPHQHLAGFAATFLIVVGLQPSMAHAQQDCDVLTIPHVAKLVAPNVVRIDTVNREPDVAPGIGSGVIVDVDGNTVTVVTNRHVLQESREATVTLITGEQYSVDNVINFDYARDLALFTIAAADLSPADIGGSNKVEVGEAIVVVGSGLGLDGTVTSGIVSSIRLNNGGEHFQMTAPISRGNSGGGMFNMCGQLIGIPTLSYERGQNINFAVSAKHVEELLDVRDEPVTLEGFTDAISGQRLREDEDLTILLAGAPFNDADSQYIIGLNFHNNGDYGQALDWYLRAAYQGHQMAQNHIGVFYHEGLGVERDSVEAAEWYRRAAYGGHPEAQNNIGYLYLHGEGVPRDITRALLWFHRSANQGWVRLFFVGVPERSMGRLANSRARAT